MVPPYYHSTFISDVSSVDDLSKYQKKKSNSSHQEKDLTLKRHIADLQLVKVSRNKVMSFLIRRVELELRFKPI